MHFLDFFSPTVLLARFLSAVFATLELFFLLITQPPALKKFKVLPLHCLITHESSLFATSMEKDTAFIEIQQTLIRWDCVIGYHNARNRMPVAFYYVVKDIIWFILHEVYFNSAQKLEPANTTQFQSPWLPTTTELSSPDNHVQPAPLVGPRPMKKYTGNGQASLSRNPSSLVSSRHIAF